MGPVSVLSDNLNMSDIAKAPSSEGRLPASSLSMRVILLTSELSHDTSCLPSIAHTHMHIHQRERERVTARAG